MTKVIFKKNHRASLIALLVKNPSAMQETLAWFDSWVGMIGWRKG